MPSVYKVWLDDTRPIPDDFCGYPKGDGKVIVFLCTEIYCVKLLYLKGYVNHVSFDHDLGEGKETGYDLAKWFEELAFKGIAPAITWDVHSANAPGSRYIRLAMSKATLLWSEKNIRTHLDYPLDKSQKMWYNRL